MTIRVNPYSTEGKVLRLKSMPQYLELDSYKCRRERLYETVSTIVGGIILLAITGGLIVLAAYAEGVLK